jgi:hypothetical protein
MIDADTGGGKAGPRIKEWRVLSAGGEHGAFSPPHLGSDHVVLKKESPCVCAWSCRRSSSSP